MTPKFRLSSYNSSNKFCVIITFFLLLCSLFIYLKKYYDFSYGRRTTIDEIQGYLYPPVFNMDYNLEHPEKKDPSEGQAKAAIEILGEMRNKGFFIECGAYDGEFISNTLYMERYLGWSGLLIEAGKENFQKLKKKNRKAWTSDTCLSPTIYSNKINFTDVTTSGGHIVSNKKNESAYYTVQCFPFEMYLLALNVKTVDYFSLDVEGVELAVLDTIPFDKILIKVISLEYNHSGKDLDFWKEYMAKRNYTYYTSVNERFAADYIFKHNSL